ncbi:MAG: conjugal transfer protein TraX [Oscillospiraceae bacterium]|nr:conjugal transfer protein TraX [Oscillospiraceae bacterium]
MDAFKLKLIAMITMIIDHSGYLVFGGFSFFNYIGRLAFPIFAFQISQGYIHTKNIWKYMLRLFIFALISQIPFTLFIYVIRGGDVWYEYIWQLNIFFTLFLGLLAILIYDKLSSFILKHSQDKLLITILVKILSLLPAIALGILAHFINTDYGFYGVAIILLFYLFRQHKPVMALSFATAVIVDYSITVYRLMENRYPINTFEHIRVYFEAGLLNRFIILATCTILPLIFILLYNGEKGKNLKQALYWFYPVHLLLIYILSLLHFQA